MLILGGSVVCSLGESICSFLKGLVAVFWCCGNMFSLEKYVCYFFKDLLVVFLVVLR